MRLIRYIVVLLFFAVLLAGCSNSGTSTQGPKELIDRRCSRCHTLERVYTARPADAWPDIVDAMIARSPGLLSQTEKEAVITFLQNNYGN